MMVLQIRFNQVHQQHVTSYGPEGDEIMPERVTLEEDGEVVVGEIRGRDDVFGEAREKAVKSRAIEQTHDDKILVAEQW